MFQTATKVGGSAMTAPKSAIYTCAENEAYSVAAQDRVTWHGQCQMYLELPSHQLAGLDDVAGDHCPSPSQAPEHGAGSLDLSIPNSLYFQKLAGT